MKKIAIIGGGIIGITLANYLNLEQFQVTLYDEGVGQATSASAGIISPWTSKRRNQKWYQLAKDGAAFFPKLVRDFHLSTDIYAQTGALILRKEGEFDSLLTLANERKKRGARIRNNSTFNKRENTPSHAFIKTSSKFVYPRRRPTKWTGLSGKNDNFGKR